MTSLPDRIKVGPFDIDVVLDQAAIDRKGVESHEDLLGRFEARELTILLAPGQAPQMLAETLMHEVLHACSAAAGNPLDHGAEEALVSAISPQLFGVLRANPALLEFLTSD